MRRTLIIQQVAERKERLQFQDFCLKWWEEQERQREAELDARRQERLSEYVIQEPFSRSL